MKSCIVIFTEWQNIFIERNELCVIPDKKVTKEINCITAISIPILVDILYEYLMQMR